MQISELIQQCIDEVIKQAKDKNNTDATTNVLTEAETELSNVRNLLRDLEKYVRLDVEDRSAIDFGAMSVLELIKSSELIGAIHKAGVDVKNRELFPSNQKHLASAIGENFNIFSEQLAKYRSAKKKQKKENEWSILSKGGKEIFMFLEALEQRGVIDVERVLLSNNGKWVNFRWEHGATSKPVQKFLLIFKVIDSKLSHFLTGDWMTAFVSNVIEDHLDRNGASYEIFSKVAYSAPPDIIRSQSDFDIISLLKKAKTANCFECKSGKINADQAAEIVQKGTDIKNVLEKFSPDIENVELFLVYDHYLNPEEHVEKFFEGTPVVAKRIDQIRELVMNWI